MTEVTSASDSQPPWSTIADLGTASHNLGCLRRGYLPPNAGSAAHSSRIRTYVDQLLQGRFVVEVNSYLPGAHPAGPFIKAYGIVELGGHVEDRPKPSGIGSVSGHCEERAADPGIPLGEPGNDAEVLW